jgi:hypothetical protein
MPLLSNQWLLYLTVFKLLTALFSMASLHLMMLSWYPSESGVRTADFSEALSSSAS